MIGSIWSGTNLYQGYSLTETQKERERKAAGAAANLFDPIQKRKEAEKEATHPEATLGISLDNNVKAAIYAGQVAAQPEDETTLPTGGTSAPAAPKDAAAGGEDEDKMEIFYKTIVLPDGSKLLQIITKHPDGSVKTSTTRVPGSKDDESTTRKETITVPKKGGGENEADGDGSAGQALMDAVGLE